MRERRHYLPRSKGRAQNMANSDSLKKIRGSLGQSGQAMTEYVILLVVVMLPLVKVVDILWQVVATNHRLIAIFVNLPFP